MNKGFRNFLIRSLIFVTLFILISLIIGQRIVSSNLLYGFWIAIYGGLGKILLFSIFGFVLFYRDKLMKIKYLKYNKRNFLFLLVSFLLVIGFYILELNISFIDNNLFNIILVHLLFLSIFAFLGLGIFGLKFVKYFCKKFKKELFYFLIFGLSIYSLMLFVWKLWPYFSYVVLKIVAFFLSFVASNVYATKDSILFAGGFAAEIGEACSGIYSIFIFSSLYIFGVFLDWGKFNKKKIFLIFIPALIGAFFVNVFRVFLLYIFGIYISKTIALGLYHSYVGMIFFLIYFAIFWMIFYKWFKK